MVTVSEDDIRHAMRTLICQAHIWPSPAERSLLPPSLAHGDKLPQARKIVVVISGGNSDPQLLAQNHLPRRRSKGRVDLRSIRAQAELTCKLNLRVAG